MKCDSSRPESISYLQHHGHGNATAAAKWPGSILDGISFLRSFESIVVHPRCVKTLDELKNYQYRIDKLTGLPLTEPEDKNNHLIDALRYALSDVIRLGGNNSAVLTNWYRDQNKKVAPTVADPHHLTETVLTNGASKKPKALVPLWARPGVKVESL